MEKTRLNKSVNYKAVIIVLILYYFIRPYSSDAFTPFLSDLLFLIIILKMFKVNLNLKKLVFLFFTFLELLVTYVIRQRKYSVPLGICIILVFFIFYQNSEINKINNKLVLIENKLGGNKEINCNINESVKKIKQSVVRVVGGEAEGSGFAVTYDGLIITNFHVIEFEPSPKIVFSDNTFETATIEMADKQADLAVLRVERKLPMINFGYYLDLTPTQDLYAIGYPLGGDIPGDATISKGILSAIREPKDSGLTILQTDIDLNQGVSGGPMIDTCGDVYGINTAGMSGMGWAISSDTILQKLNKMSLDEDPLKDVKKITIDPDLSPTEAVKAFYNYLKLRKLPEAFSLLSDNFKEGHGYDYWKKGYETMLDTSIISSSQDGAVNSGKNIVKVKLTTTNLVDGEFVYKAFEGTWEVRELKGMWQLWEANVKEVKNPDYFWFYE